MVKVKQNEEAPVAAEILADSIVAISEGIKKLRSGRLNDRALFLLIQSAAPSYHANGRTVNVTIADIKAVFAGIEDLERSFLKKKI